jgi:hypothetical protein
MTQYAFELYVRQALWLKIMGCQKELGIARTDKDEARITFWHEQCARYQEAYNLMETQDYTNFRKVSVGPDVESRKS